MRDERGAHPPAGRTSRALKLNRNRATTCDRPHTHGSTLVSDTGGQGGDQYPIGSRDTRARRGGQGRLPDLFDSVPDVMRERRGWG